MAHKSGHSEDTQLRINALQEILTKGSTERGAKSLATSIWGENKQDGIDSETAALVSGKDYQKLDLKAKYTLRISQKIEAIEWTFGERRLVEDQRAKQFISRWTKACAVLEKSEHGPKNLERCDGSYTVPVPALRDYEDLYQSLNLYLSLTFDRFLWEAMEKIILRTDSTGEKLREFCSIQNRALVVSKNREFVGYPFSINTSRPKEWYTIGRNGLTTYSCSTPIFEWDITRKVYDLRKIINFSLPDDDSILRDTDVRAEVYTRQEDLPNYQRMVWTAVKGLSQDEEEEDDDCDEQDQMLGGKNNRIKKWAESININPEDPNSPVRRWGAKPESPSSRSGEDKTTYCLVVSRPAASTPLVTQSPSLSWRRPVTTKLSSSPIWPCADTLASTNVPDSSEIPSSTKRLQSRQHNVYIPPHRRGRGCFEGAAT